MANNKTASEKQAAIFICVMALLVMATGFVGFAIWERTSPAMQVSMPKTNVPSRIGRAAPLQDPGTWVTTSDYPATSLLQEQEGTTKFTMHISEEGQPTYCNITNSSGHADLDAATCKALMRRARFNPALDVSGKAVSSTYINRVRWQIPTE